MGIPEIALQTTRGVLFHADCMDVFPLLRSGCVNTVFADPPFNLGKEYGSEHSDLLRDDAYVEWCHRWLGECVRVLAPGGSLFVHNLPKWNILLAGHLLSLGSMSFRSWIAISTKNGFARAKRLYPAHYSLIYFTKGRPAVFNRDLVRVPPPKCRSCNAILADWGGYKAKRNPLGVNLSDVWTDVSPVRHRRTKTRPLGLNELCPKIPERAILLTTNPGDIVVDPFGGGGSTYRVAELHGRFWVGSEIADCAPAIGALTNEPSTVVRSEAPEALKAALPHLWPAMDAARLPQQD